MVGPESRRLLCRRCRCLLGFGGRLFESKELFRPESFIVHLCSGFNEILQVSSRKEVSQVNKLAMSFILDVDNPPPVLPSTHGFAINDDTSFRANDGEWKHFPNTLVELKLLLVEFVRVKGKHSDLIVMHFGQDPLFEKGSFLQSQGVGFCNDWHYIDYFGKFFEDHNVNRFQSVARGVDEEKTAVDTSIRNEAVSHGCEFFTQISGVLVFYIFDDWIPAAFVVNIVPISGSVYDVQLQSHPILHDHVGLSSDFCRLTGHNVWFKPSFGLDEVRGKKCVDEGGLSEASLPDYHHIELEATLQEFMFDLPSDRIETDIRSGRDPFGR